MASEIAKLLREDIVKDIEYWREQTRVEYPTLHAMSMRQQVEQRLCEHDEMFGANDTDENAS